MRQPEQAMEADARQECSFRPGAYVVRARLDISVGAKPYRNPFAGIVYAESLQQLASLLENSHYRATYFEYSPMQAGDGVLVNLVFETESEAQADTDHAATSVVRPVSLKDDFTDQDVGITATMSQIYQPGGRLWFPVPEDVLPEGREERWSLPPADEVAAQQQLLSLERLLQAHDSMSPAEKAAFTSWESRFVVGDGVFGSTDWPGWPAVIARLSN